MSSDRPTPAPAAAVAALVPGLLDLHPEPADVACEMALADAIERAADALLAWHDRLVFGTARAAPTVEDARTPPPVAGEPGRSVHSGVLPGNPASLHLTAVRLRSVADAVRMIGAGVAAPDASSDRITAALDDLADALLTHARLLRALDAELSRPAADERTIAARRSQVLARVTKAERALERRAVATLPG